ncbi:uracil-DNA glycosylase [Anaerotalea alkaliphila]|uniref:Uracil-DNA glycosylase n=1 Tax=Anaerotalea alkaliphila TaxID=2662126 RepID=A0A7X5HWK8_9FIRM|nr:uracil-DNA glycosylase [Anaerotalea alkaliphila]NDL67993.1 uracil-DNA glycosylase [Anaerotalea alkaliphila]
MGRILHNRWEEVIGEEFGKPYYLEIRETLRQAYRSQRIFPPAEEIFSALHMTDYDDVKVVILGQDPYHGPGQAHGLSFSVREGVAIPPSLRNIYKELQNDLGCRIPTHGCLEKWARQGVLLLNAVLTVQAESPASHSKLGWQNFTDEIIRKLNRREKPVVFILWGSYARSKKNLITEKRHLILESPHPSPLSASRGFFGSRPFSKTNVFLTSIGETPIDWQIY